MDKFTIAYVPNVDIVKEIKKLPFPVFSSKKYNYQYGGLLQIDASVGQYETTYTPNFDCELKSILLCISYQDTSQPYSNNDTYDVLIGNRYIVQGSYVKDKIEKKDFELLESIPANTTIKIKFNNNSGLEKKLLFDLSLLTDAVIS